MQFLQHTMGWLGTRQQWTTVYSVTDHNGPTQIHDSSFAGISLSKSKRVCWAKSGSIEYWHCHCCKDLPPAQPDPHLTLLQTAFPPPYLHWQSICPILSCLELLAASNSKSFNSSTAFSAKGTSAADCKNHWHLIRLGCKILIPLCFVQDGWNWKTSHNFEQIRVPIF